MKTIELRSVIADTEDICIELLGAKALCRECTIDPQGSIPELDFRAFSSTDAGEFSAHLLKHRALRHSFPLELTELKYWEAALSATQRP